MVKKPKTKIGCFTNFADARCDCVATKSGITVSILGICPDIETC